jgi:hypothetical protein
VGQRKDSAGVTSTGAEPLMVGSRGTCHGYGCPFLVINAKITFENQAVISASISRALGAPFYSLVASLFFAFLRLVTVTRFEATNSMILP